MIEYIKVQMFQYKEVQRVNFKEPTAEKRERKQDSVIPSIDLNIDHCPAPHTAPWARCAVAQHSHLASEHCFST